MEEAARNLYFLSFFIYSAGLVLICFCKGSRLNSLGKKIIISAFLVHTAAFILYIILCGYVPMHKRVQNCLPRTWGLGLVLVFILKRHKEKFVPGMVILTLLVIFVSGLPFPLPSQMETREVFIGAAPFFWFHIYDFSFVLFAFFFDGSPKDSAARGFLVKRIQNTALWGFILFTIAQLAGSVWAVIDFGDYWHWKPMHLMSVSIWMFYAGMIHLKWVKGLSYRVLPAMGTIGFAGILWWSVYHDYARQMISFAGKVF